MHCPTKCCLDPQQTHIPLALRSARISGVTHLARDFPADVSIGLECVLVAVEAANGVGATYDDVLVKRPIGVCAGTVRDFCQFCSARCQLSRDWHRQTIFSIDCGSFA